MNEVTPPEEYDVQELEGSFSDTRVGQGAVPAKDLPSQPMRGVSDAIGDEQPDQHSSGVRDAPAPGEYVYGTPGAEMESRRSTEVRANGEVEVMAQRMELAPARPISSTAPEKCLFKSNAIAGDLYAHGIGFYKFFVSSSLPQGTQWFFPIPRVMMINTLDFVEVQVKLAQMVSELTGFKGDGFVGDPSSLYDDPTFGPMMAMSGMFNVKKEAVDE